MAVITLLEPVQQTEIEMPDKRNRKGGAESISKGDSGEFVLLPTCVSLEPRPYDIDGSNLEG